MASTVAWKTLPMLGFPESAQSRGHDLLQVQVEIVIPRKSGPINHRRVITQTCEIFGEICHAYIAAQPIHSERSAFRALVPLQLCALAGHQSVHREFLRVAVECKLESVS
jgi:hypothetical protein